MEKIVDRLVNLLNNENDGLLIKYHFNQGLDLQKLDDLYDVLEQLKSSWKNKDDLPEEIVFHLVSIVPSLYMDLPLYAGKSGYEDYEDILYSLDTAISMCMNPDTTDPHFNTPLKELGDF